MEECALSYHARRPRWKDGSWGTPISPCPPWNSNLSSTTSSCRVHLRQYHSYLSVTRIREYSMFQGCTPTPYRMIGIKCIAVAFSAERSARVSLNLGARLSDATKTTRTLGFLRSMEDRTVVVRRIGRGAESGERIAQRPAAAMILVLVL